MSDDTRAGPRAAPEAPLGLARVGDPSGAAGLKASLARMPLASGEPRVAADTLRIYGLTFLRLGPPDSAERDRLAAELLSRFPSPDEGLEWCRAEDLWRQGLAAYLADLGEIYRRRSCLWRGDPNPAGFSWIDLSDRDNCVLAYLRCDGNERLVVVLNLTPVPREHYQLGVPEAKAYRCLLSSDEKRYGGSDCPPVERVATELASCHGQPRSIVLRLPPLGALVLEPVD